MTLYMIELPVRDLSASLAWYRDYLGLTVERIDPERPFALLRSAGGSWLALKQYESPMLPGSGHDRSSTVLQSIRVHFHVNDLEQTLAQLEVSDPEWKISPEGYRRALLTDPDGYSVVLFEWLQPGTGSSTRGSPGGP